MKSKIKPQDYSSYEAYERAWIEEVVQEEYLIKNLVGIAVGQKRYINTSICQYFDIAAEVLGKEQFPKLLKEKSVDDVILEISRASEFIHALAKKLDEELASYKKIESGNEK